VSLLFNTSATELLKQCPFSSTTSLHNFCFISITHCTAHTHAKKFAKNSSSPSTRNYVYVKALFLRFLFNGFSKFAHSQILFFNKKNDFIYVIFVYTLHAAHAKGKIIDSILQTKDTSYYVTVEVCINFKCFQIAISKSR